MTLKQQFAEIIKNNVTVAYSVKDQLREKVDVNIYYPDVITEKILSLIIKEIEGKKIERGTIITGYKNGRECDTHIEIHNQTIQEIIEVLKCPTNT